MPRPSTKRTPKTFGGPSQPENPALIAAMVPEGEEYQQTGNFKLIEYKYAVSKDMFHNPILQKNILLFLVGRSFSFKTSSKRFSSIKNHDFSIFIYYLPNTFWHFDMVKEPTPDKTPPLALWYTWRNLKIRKCILRLVGTLAPRSQQNAVTYF